MKKEKFNIQGMSCSSCQSHVQKAVEKLDGVKTVNVNLLSNTMQVEFDEKKLNHEKIIKAVIEAGYSATCQINKKKINNDKNIKSMKNRLTISLCFWIPLMYIAMHTMFHNWFGLPIPKFINNTFDGNSNALVYAFSQLILLIPIVYVNKNYFINGFKRLFKLSPNMDSLIAIGSFASIIYGIYAIFKIIYGIQNNDWHVVETFRQDIYFESAATILTLITVGKYLETKAKGRTGEAISKLIKLAPKTAIILKNGKEAEIASEEIKVNDIVIIKPGYSIPVDGIVIGGKSWVDESSITGESIPVGKSLKDKLISGTINKQGSLKMKATKVGEDTTLSNIIKLVEEAGSSKAPIEKLADKVSGVFVPIVILIAIISSIIWILLGQSFEFALSIGIAVLVISCPCALGLATPVAIMVSTGKGAQNGILIKSAESLELLHKIDTVVLDKTGTITEGKPQVIEIITKIDENKLLQIAASLEKLSEHPLAEAIMKKADGVELLEVEEFLSTSGRGIEGIIDNKKFFLGSIKWMKENNVNDVYNYSNKIKKLLEQGKTIIYLGEENKLVGAFAIADSSKKTSFDAIQELKNRNLEVIMLTGDNETTAKSIGKELNIDKIISEVMPQDKENVVSNLQKQGKKVLFVGDGINDSPALVKADVGMAIGSGTDIAIESADIILIKNDLLDVVTSIDLSKKTIQNIKMNLFWAFFYNAIGISLAAGVFYLGFGIKLNPMIGATAMSFSSVCVVTNALRLKRFKSKYKQTKIKERKDEKVDNKKIISIEGMQCNHCKMSVEKALYSIEGITSVNVSLEEKRAEIEYNIDIENSKIKEAIEEIGFEVKEIK